MKTARITSFRVQPAMRRAVENVLEEGETLSSFIELALRTQIARRKNQSKFIARGLASLEEYKRTGGFYTADEVLADLDRILEEAEAKASE